MKHASCRLQNQEGLHPQGDSLTACLGGNTLAQQIEVLDWYHKDGRNQSATARHFAPLYPNLQMKQPLVSSWVKDESNWCEIWDQSNCQSDQTAK
jgi:Helix-turn-helix domain (DUF4817)